MSHDFDVSEIATKLLQSNIDRLIGMAGSGANDVLNQVRARFKRTYKVYVKRLLERYAKGKSFFVRSESAPLYDVFVPLSLTTELRTLERPEAIDLGSIAPFSIITGSGGSGKSMMMRHLLVSAVKSAQKVPVFLELRSMNQNNASLVDALINAMQVSGLDIDQEFLEVVLNTGQLYLLLDGFDEVNPDKRELLASDIRDLAGKHPLNWITISSRPDRIIQGWEEFGEFSLRPLNLAEAVDLIQKVPFDEVVKLRFVNDLEQYLFDEHYTFLSNPLLLSIMLLTYGDSGKIPHKMSTFYRTAVDALFQRHDAWKSGYLRHRQTNLDIQDFVRMLSAFSLVSYDGGEFSFTDSRALELVELAKKITQLKVDSRSFIHDAIQAVCVLLEDGIEITFAHRTFQEYFVARFIHSAQAEIKAQLISRFAPNVESDEVMRLLYELDPIVVEQHYILPTMAEVKQQLKLKRRVGVTHLLRYLRLAYGRFRVSQPIGREPRVTASWRNVSYTIALEFAFFRYCDSVHMIDSDSDALLKFFIDEFGEDAEVPTSAIRLNSPLLQALEHYSFFWNTRYLQAVLDLEWEIKRRHIENKESLESVLKMDRTVLAIE